MDDSKYIFIVDDDPDTIDSVCKWLKKEGFLVQNFSNSAALYEVLDKQIPDILLLDVKLGSEDGRKISQEIRRRYTARFPIVLFSVLIEFIERADDFGADDFVRKDISLRELTAIIIKHMKVGYK